MQARAFYEQLKERRVIRAAVIYAALLWVSLQVADLLAGAALLSDATVRWLILAGVVGFPLTLIGSWFLESPWQERRWTAIAGDLFIIIAIAVAAFLFAWQQWFQSFTRPAIAVLAIEATDVRDDTADLADHLTQRVRMLLASRAELKVVELESSTHPALASLSPQEQAEVLGVSWMLGGTLSRGGDDLRWTMQLYDGSGDRVWSEQLSDRLSDQAAMQSRFLRMLWPQLPLAAEGLDETLAIVSACDYPVSGTDILDMVSAKPAAPGVLAGSDAGLVRVMRVRNAFARIADLPPQERPVAQSLAMQALGNSESTCPAYPELRMLRLQNTRVFEQEGTDAAKFMTEFPNASDLYRRLAMIYEDNGDTGEAAALLREAVDLNPASTLLLCDYQARVDSEELPTELEHRLATFLPGGCDQ